LGVNGDRIDRVRRSSAPTRHDLLIQALDGLASASFEQQLRSLRRTIPNMGPTCELQKMREPAEVLAFVEEDEEEVCRRRLWSSMSPPAAATPSR
jgi:hypothetical protein